MCVFSCSVIANSLQPHGLQPARLLCPWNFLGKNTGVGCHFLLQGIFPTQRTNPCLWSPLHWQAASLPLHHLGSPESLWYCCPVAKLCQILYDPMDCSMLGFPVLTISWSWLRFISIKSLMSFNYLTLCCSLLLPSIFLRSRVFCNVLALCIMWPKYWRIFMLSLFSHSVLSNSLWPHELQHARLPCPSPSPRCRAWEIQSLLKPMSIELVMPSNHLIFCHPLLLPSTFPSIMVFSNE